MKPKVTREFRAHIDYSPILEAAEGMSDEDFYAARVDYDIASDPEAPPSDEQQLAQLLSQLLPEQIKELKDRAASMVQGRGRRRERRVHALICMYKGTYRDMKVKPRSMWKFITDKINAQINTENPGLHCNYSQRNLQKIYKNNSR